MRRISTDDTPRKALRLLFADDERSLQELMRLELPAMGHDVTVCPDGMTAVAALEENSYDCLILDLDMPGLGGIDVLARARELNPDSETIILTGKASLDTAIAALRQGAFDYLTKPCKLIELEAILDHVAEKRELTNKYRALERQLRRIQGPTCMVGDNPSMQRVGRLVAKVAPTNSTVLILGETGTGKELVARSLHEQSHRHDMPFVAVNCGALPETLIESELFGHRRGSFTGADEHRVGLLEVANHGTLFLDEIGELPKAMQAKLLRVLESGEIRRVGENEPRLVDVRVLCATHRNLGEMVDKGEFREDLLVSRERFRDRHSAAAAAIGRRAGAGRASAYAVSFRRAARKPEIRSRRRRPADVAHLAGKRPRAGQRRRARHDPGWRGANRGRAPAGQFHDPPAQRRTQVRRRDAAGPGAASDPGVDRPQ